MASPNNLDLSTSQRASFVSLSNGSMAQQVVQAVSADLALAPSLYKNAGAATKANIKASAGAVVALRVTNANAAIRYFQLHNKATAPAGAETAQIYFLIPAGTATVPAIIEIGQDWFANQEYFATGIGFAISTTEGTFTDSATASDHEVNVRYQ